MKSNSTSMCSTDESGAVAAAYEYDAFGNILSSSGPLAAFFRHRFSTKLFDPDTGLYYYGYRWYSPAIGRWISRDPIEENGGENLFRALENNSLKYVDFHGKKPICDCIDVQILIFRRDNWKSIWSADYPSKPIAGGEVIPYAEQNKRVSFFDDYLYVVEVNVFPKDLGKCFCGNGEDFHWPRVRISTPTTVKYQDPWTTGFNMQGLSFTNHHVTETLMPRFPEGTLRKITVEVLSLGAEEVLCQRKEFTISY